MALLSAKNAVVFIFFIYIIPRILVLLIPVEASSDAAWYFHRAVDLANGNGYSEGGVPTAFWPPGWPIMMSVLFKQFGVSLFAVQIFNMICAVLTGWLILDIGRRLFQSETAGRTGLLLFAIYPNAIGFVPLALTEVFYTTLLLAGCWILIAHASFLSLLLAGFVFAAATLVKAQSLVVIPLIFFVAAMQGKFSTRKFGASAAKTGIVILVSLLLVSPWSYRNYQIFGEWVLVSTNGGHTLLTGNNPSARGDYTPNDPLVTSIKWTVENQLEIDKEARNRALNWITDNPGAFVALIPLKFFRLWAPDGESEWAYQIGYKQYDNHVFLFRTARYINQIYYFCLLFGFAWAGYQLILGRVTVGNSRFGWWLLPYAIALYPTAIAIIFSGQSRFHYPVMPFVVMCCGWILIERLERTKVVGPATLFKRSQK